MDWSGYQTSNLNLLTSTVLITALINHLLLNPAASYRSDCPEGCSCKQDDVTESFSHMTCNSAHLTELPRSFASSVTSVDVRGNSLLRIASGSLAGFRNVIQLSLGENEIGNIADGAFEECARLQTLNLSGNELKGIGQYTFAGVEMMLHLDLSSNLLEDVDGGFSRLKELSKLNLENNSLTRITEDTFKDLINLRYLLLSNNRISFIDNKAFRNLEKLMYLVLKGNPLGVMETFSFNSLFLSYVDLSQCNLTSVPRGLPNSIRYLQLRRNNIRKLDPQSFTDCPYVSILILDDNSLSDIHADTFRGMVYLRQLWLNHNRLEKIPEGLPKSLQRLLMESNLIQELSGSFPPALAQLNTLSLAGNGIYDVKADVLTHLTGLRSLDLSNNRIRRLYGHTFFNNTHLKNILLSRNPLEYFNSRCFHGLHALQRLSLSYITSAGSSLHYDIFRDLGTLSRLELDHSPGIVHALLDSDVLLRSLPRLQELSMYDVDLTSLRPDFPNFFPDLVVFRIYSSRWHCDSSLAWFRVWCATTTIDVVSIDENLCYSPPLLHGKPIMRLADNDFIPPNYAQESDHDIPTPTTVKNYNINKINIRQQNNEKKNIEREKYKDLNFLDLPDPFQDVDHYNQFPLEDYSYSLYDVVSSTDRNTVTTISSDRQNKRQHATTIIESLPSPSSVQGIEIFNDAGNANRKNVRRGNQPITSTKSPDLHLGIRSTHPDVRYYRMPTSGGKRSSGELLPHEGSENDVNSEKAPVSERSIAVICAAVATIFVTLLIAILIIMLIINLTRKNRRDNERNRTNRRSFSGAQFSAPISSGKGESTKNSSIQYNHNSNKLYFLTKASNGSLPTDAVVIVDPRAKTDPSTDGSVSTCDRIEPISLVPGRDINHEGPVRVYRWADF